MEKKRLLIVVKTYPAKSRKYTETVCTAGIDLESKTWVRLYPVDFRYRTKDKQYKKYDIIEVNTDRNPKDNRPESFKVDVDSIKIVENISTKNDWKERKDILMPLVNESMCSIIRENKTDGTSLGMFKPSEVTDLVIERKEPDDNEDIDSEQLLLFDNKKELETIPYIFRYKYKCSEPGCRGHNQCIIDWEIGQAYRSWREDYNSEDEALNKIREKWLDTFFNSNRDSYLIVGSQRRFNTFMVLGVFWLPKV